MQEQNNMGTEYPPYFTAPNFTDQPQSNWPQGPYSQVPPIPQSMPYSVIPKVGRQPFAITQADKAMLFICLGLGIAFATLVYGIFGYGIFIFTLLYAGTILWYARSKSIPISKISWFWFVIFFCTGLTYALWGVGMLGWARGVFFLFSGLYWAASVFRILINEKTSNFFFPDLLNVFVKIPCKNYDTPVLSLGREKKGDKTKHKIALSILLGLVMTLPLLSIILPNLAGADQNGFGNLLLYIQESIRRLLMKLYFNTSLVVILQKMVIALFVGYYLYAALSAFAHKRYVASVDKNQIRKTSIALAKIPNGTIVTILLFISFIYIVFIFFQIPYFFSAFKGQTANENQFLSDYARDGFFELCNIAFINLLVLGSGSLLCRTPMRKSLVLQIANVLLSLLTLLVISTAISKMWLYIQLRGYTEKRVITTAFMLFLALIFIGIIVLQWKKYSIVRLSVLAGSILFCSLLLANINGFIIRQNFALYSSGQHKEFDMEMISYCGPEGAAQALEFYQEMEEGPMKQELGEKIHRMQSWARSAVGTLDDTWTFSLLRRNPVNIE